jgi:hypothetical protein
MGSTASRRMIAPTWHRFNIVLATAGGGHPVEAWRLHVGALLVVTPQLSSELIVTRDAGQGVS